MKLRVMVVGAMCFLISSFAVADQVLSQSYTISDRIRYIEAGDSVTVELRQGETASLSAEATAAELERVTVDVKGERLTLGVEREKGGFWGWFAGNDHDVKFVVQLPQPVGLTLLGASQALVGDIETQTFGVDASGASHAHVQKLVVNKLELDASGASKISIEKIQAQELKVSSSGASKVEVSGSSNTDKLDADISGASKYLGRNLVAKQAKVNASGASRADIHVADSMAVDVSGASHISYMGSPRIKQDVSGASGIESVDKW